MLVGALAAIVAGIVRNETIANEPRQIGYWFGTALAGALIGLAVAAFMNRRR